MKTYEEASKHIPTPTLKKRAQLRGTKGYEKVKYMGNVWKMDLATAELFGE